MTYKKSFVEYVRVAQLNAIMCNLNGIFCCFCSCQAYLVGYKERQLTIKISEIQFQYCLYKDKMTDFRELKYIVNTVCRALSFTEFKF